MAENRRYRCCERALKGARLSDHQPTLDDLAWLFGISRRWAGELRKRGVLPEGEALPALVRRMAKYNQGAKAAQRSGARTARSGAAKQ